MEANTSRAPRPNNATLWSGHGLGPALAQRVDDDYRRAYDMADANHSREVNDCNQRVDEPCRIRADAGFCAVREQLFQRRVIGSLQRFNFAARNFDNIAGRMVKSAEFELADARAYADRTFKLQRLAATAASESRSVGAQTSVGDYALDGVNLLSTRVCPRRDQLCRRWRIAAMRRRLGRYIVRTTWPRHRNPSLSCSRASSWALLRPRHLRPTLQLRPRALSKLCFPPPPARGCSCSTHGADLPGTVKAE